MVTIHCTRKLLNVWPTTKSQGEPTTTVLGNWYANILDIEPDVVLFMNENTLLAVPVMAEPINELYLRFVEALMDLLAGLGVPEHMVVAEVQQMLITQVSKTVSQSKVASLNDQAQLLKRELFSTRRPSLEKATRKLMDFPYGANGYRTTPEMVELAFGISPKNARKLF